MPLVPCLYTGYPGELEHPETGAKTILVPGETVFDVPEEVADTHPHWHRVEPKPEKPELEKPAVEKPATKTKGDG